MPSTDIEFLGNILHEAVTEASKTMAATQKQIALAADKTEAESVKVQRKLSRLTGILAFVGFLQAIAIGWPYISWWLGQQHGLYEVVERTDKEVPNFRAAGTHMAVEYVLLHDGHRIFATCDRMTLDHLDPNATCGFRPLRKYSCRLGQQSDKALSDLLCKDAEGSNVYLYVSKKE